MSQEEDVPDWTPTAQSDSESRSRSRSRSRRGSEPEVELEAESGPEAVFPDNHPGSLSGHPDPAAVSMCPKGMSHARTLLDRVMESRDWPDNKMIQFTIPARVPWDVKEMCILVARLFNNQIKVRGRHGEQHITVWATTDEQALYISNYFKKVASFSMTSDPINRYRFGEIRSVTLVSCGVRFVFPRREKNRRLSRLCNYLGRDSRWGHVHQAFDCRDFKDPDYKKEVRDHIGHHPAIQKAIVQNINWLDLLQRINIRLQLLQRQRHVTLALVCRSGRHRSVGVTDLLETCFVRIGMTTTVHHHSEDRWWRDVCRGYSGCPDCAWNDDHRACHDFSAAFFASLPED